MSKQRLFTVVCLSILTYFRSDNCIKSIEGLTQENDRSTIGKAFVITMKSKIDNNLKKQLVSIGFESTIVDAIQPYGELHDYNKSRLAECMVASGDDVQFASNYFVSSGHLSLAEISLICSHRKALYKIASDSESEDSDWSMVLEDDARMNTAVQNNPRDYYSYALDQISSNPNNYGYLYLGICAGKCHTFDKLKIFGSGCTGYCAHAYAITKFRARTLYDEMYHTQHGSLPAYYNRTRLPQIDQAYFAHFQPTYLNSSLASIELHQPHANILGYSFSSPYNPTHRGIFYQTNRVNITLGSNLMGLNNFTTLICFRMVPSGKFEDLMFQYSALISLCIQRMMSADNCAFFYMMNDSTLPVYNEFIQTFQFSIPNNTLCPMGNRSYYERKFHSTIFTFDKSFFYQPSGVTLRGKFQSYHYFHHIRDIIQDKFRFPRMIQHQTNELFITTLRNVSSDYAVVCTMIGASYHVTGTGNRIDSTSHQEDFYYTVLDQLKQNLTQLIVLIFSPNGSNQFIQKLTLRYTNPLEMKFVSINQSDYHSLTTMHAISLCPHIVVNMSSYGWWGAYLSKSAQVYVPNPNHFKSRVTFKTSDYYPSNWTLVNSKRKKKTNPAWLPRIN